MLNIKCHVQRDYGTIPKTDQCDYPKNVDCGGKTVFEIRENNHCGGGFFTLILNIAM